MTNPSQPIDKLREKIDTILYNLLALSTVDDMREVHEDPEYKLAMHDLLAVVEAEIVEGRMVELELVEQALNADYDVRSYMSARIKTLADKYDTLKGEALNQPNQDEEV